MAINRSAYGTVAIAAALAVVGGLGLSAFSPNALAAPVPSDFHWTQVFPLGSPPPATCYGSAGTYNPANDTLVIYGGRGCGGAGVPQVFWLTNASGAGGNPTWVDVTPGGGPAFRNNHSAAYDAANDTVIYYAGCMFGCTPTNTDTWLLLHATGVGGSPTWAALPTSGTPSGRQGHRAFYDPASNRMIMFAGQNGGPSTCCGQLSHDVFVLTNANGTGGAASWTQLAPSGGPPPGAYYPIAAYDSASNTLTIALGGDDAGSAHNAVWLLTNANGLGGTPTWTQVVADGAPGSPSARMTSAFASDAANDKLVMFSGSGNTDTWVLDGASGAGGTPTWASLGTTGLPTPNPHFGAYDPTTNQFMVYVTNAGNNGNEFWRLSNGNGVVPPPPPVTVTALAKGKFAKAPINIKTKGRTPMTVFGSASFNVANIDESTVTFGDLGTESTPVPGTTQTAFVNKDAYPDKIFYFQKSATATPCGTTTVTIKGELMSGQQWSGSDTVKVVPCAVPQN